MTASKSLESKLRSTLTCLCEYVSTSISQLNRHRINCDIWKSRDKHAMKLYADNIWKTEYDMCKDQGQSKKRPAKNWSLELDQFIDIVTKNCIYCGAEPAIRTRVGNGRRNGIDRTNPKDHYHIENCVTCCKTCNYMKGGLTQHIFLSQVERIYSYRVLGQESLDNGSIKLVPEIKPQKLSDEFVNLLPVLKHNGKRYKPGARFSKLTLMFLTKKTIRPIRTKARGSPVHRYKWVCLCDCGNKTLVESDALGSGHIRSCGCLRFETRAPKIWEGEYRIIKTACHHRKLDFNLSFIQFRDLVTNNCTYCGGEPNIPTRLGNSFKNGIDRIDNSKHYIIDNCTTCCKICNFMKHTMNIEYFINQVINIHHHQ